MVFHLGFELPLPAPPVLDSEQDGLTPGEVQILKKQIRKNSGVIDSYVRRLDLFLNQEKVPQREAFLRKIRERMFLLMEENDTFRRVFWHHTQYEELRCRLWSRS